MRYKTVPGVVLASVCGHYYLVTAELTMEVNEITAFYWKELENGASAEELMDKAESSYEIEDKDLLIKDIDTLLDSLRQQRLIARWRS